MNEPHIIRLKQFVGIGIQLDFLLSHGLISAEEYNDMDTKIAEKIGINSCSIFRQNRWINNDFRGNMSHYKED